MLHVIVKHSGKSHPKLMGVLEKQFGEMGEDMQSHLNELYFGLAEKFGMGTPQYGQRSHRRQGGSATSIPAKSKPQSESGKKKRKTRHEQI